jgi:hypothetical protein
LTLPCCPEQGGVDYSLLCFQPDFVGCRVELNLPDELAYFSPRSVDVY